jgi:hypothetical protein
MRGRAWSCVVVCGLVRVLGCECAPELVRCMDTRLCGWVRVRGCAVATCVLACRSAVGCVHVVYQRRGPGPCRGGWPCLPTCNRRRREARDTGTSWVLTAEKSELPRTARMSSWRQHPNEHAHTHMHTCTHTHNHAHTHTPNHAHNHAHSVGGWHNGGQSHHWMLALLSHSLPGKHHTRAASPPPPVSKHTCITIQNHNITQHNTTQRIQQPPHESVCLGVWRS